jgi:hypothetical protein
MTNGPTLVTIPRVDIITCHGCKWLNRELVRSGKDPIYSFSCTHRKMKVRNLNEGYLEFYGLVKTPASCPIRNDEKLYENE